VSDTFLNNILADKTTPAYNLLTPAAQKNEPQTSWVPAIAQLSSFFLNEQPTYTGVASTSAIAVYSYSIQGLDGAYIINIKLQPEGNTWLVQSYTSSLK
jgi:hypothetical protein